jgi:predicted amidohydrolase
VSSIRVAAVQINSRQDPQANRERAARLLGRALEHRPQVVLLPEYTNFMGRVGEFPERAEARDGDWVRFLSSFAREHRVEVVAGLLLRFDGRKAANTAVHFRPDGRPGLEYRKIHLFDVDLEDGTRYRESAGLQAGDEPVTGEVAGIPSGLAICYDLRFPELFRRLAFRGARVVYLPAAFTATTGEAHWKVLLQARAIENQVFLVAADQVGPYVEGKRSYGHSLIVDPWGRILAEGPGPDDPEPEGVVAADLDFAVLEEVRRRIPCLAHRRDTLWSLSPDRT